MTYSSSSLLKFELSSSLDSFLAFKLSRSLSLCYLFRKSFSSTTIGDTNPIHTLGDYSRPSHEGYRNTIELPKWKNVVPLRSDTIRTAKLHNDILMFQQHQGESLSEAWTRFKDLLLKVPHHGLDLWLQVQIIYNHVDYINQMAIDYAADRLKEEIRIKKNGVKKIEKIMRYPDTKDLKPLNGHEFLEALTEKSSFHTPKFVSPKSLCVKYVYTIFPSPPLIRKSSFGFKRGTKNNKNVMSRYNMENLNPQRTPQVIPLFEEYTSLVTYPEEVEDTLGIPMEVEPLEETQLEDLGLNTCNHDIPLSSREVPIFDEP
ncbi:hypothetical protein Tco_1144199 [Tanacetum coccineum]